MKNRRLARAVRTLQYLSCCHPLREKQREISIYFRLKYELPNHAENGPRTCNFFPYVVNFTASVEWKFIIIILFHFIFLIYYYYHYQFSFYRVPHCEKRIESKSLCADGWNEWILCWHRHGDVECDASYSYNKIKAKRRSTFNFFPKKKKNPNFSCSDTAIFWSY